MPPELLPALIFAALVLLILWLLNVANLAWRTGYHLGQMEGMEGPEPRNYWRVVLNYAYGDKSMLRGKKP